MFLPQTLGQRPTPLPQMQFGHNPERPSSASIPMAPARCGKSGQPTTALAKPFTHSRNEIPAPALFPVRRRDTPVSRFEAHQLVAGNEQMKTLATIF